MSHYKKLMYVLAWTAFILSIIINTRMLNPCIGLMLILSNYSMSVHWI